MFTQPLLVYNIWHQRVDSLSRRHRSLCVWDISGVPVGVSINNICSWHLRQAPSATSRCPSRYKTCMNKLYQPRHSCASKIVRIRVQFVRIKSGHREKSDSVGRCEFRQLPPVRDCLLSPTTDFRLVPDYRRIVSALATLLIYIKCIKSTRHGAESFQVFGVYWFTWNWNKSGSFSLPFLSKQEAEGCIRGSMLREHRANDPESENMRRADTNKAALTSDQGHISYAFHQP